MNLTEFIAKDLNQANVGDNDQNKGQCTGLVSLWMDNLGAPHEFGNAIDLLNNADHNYFDVIDNTPTNIPLPGDILIWGDKVGVDGHTAIFVDGDANTFHSFDQNWPLGSNCHLQLHNYYGVVGWLHPKPQNTSPSDDEQRALNVLKSHFSTSTDQNSQPFTTLEGYTNTLTQDAYVAWKHPPVPANISPTQARILAFFKGLGIS